MSTKSPYTYVVLRYRHDPLTAEFANVGVVLHQPALGFLDARLRRTSGRISQIFPDLDGAALRSSLRDIERAIRRIARSEAGDLLTSLTDAAAVARRILPEDDTSFVWGPLGSGLTADPAKTLDQLYDRFVARYDEQPRVRRDDEAVWRPVRDRLAELHLADRLQPKRIESRIDAVEFQHAWKNGAWHCYQPLSFDLANEEVIREKARRWAGLMSTGGAARKAADGRAAAHRGRGKTAAHRDRAAARRWGVAAACAPGPAPAEPAPPRPRAAAHRPGHRPGHPLGRRRHSCRGRPALSGAAGRGAARRPAHS